MPRSRKYTTAAEIREAINRKAKAYYHRFVCLCSLVHEAEIHLDIGNTFSNALRWNVKAKILGMHYDISSICCTELSNHNQGYSIATFPDRVPERKR